MDMKKYLLGFLLLVGSHSATSQWGANNVSSTTNQNARFTWGTGNVGIGTAVNGSISDRLHVIGNIRASSNFITETGILNVPGTSLPLSFQTNGTSRMTILNSGNVGIGITSPTNRLDVVGSTFNRISAGVTADVQTGFQAIKTGTNATNWEMYVPATSTDFRFNNAAIGDIMFLKADGKVGIGASPSERLHVTGSTRSNRFNSTTGVFSTIGATDLTLSTNSLLADGTGGSPWVTIRNTDGWMGINTASASIQERLHVTGNTRTSGNFITDGGTLNVSHASNSFKIQMNGVTKFTMLNDGKVGIGTALTTNPNGYTLAVNGKIGAKDVQVENNSTTWADYVFEKDYKLTPLNEVEQYIKANQHLEGVPTATEVKEKGYSLSNMDEILLKKVEELTLYVIEQQKEIERLKATIKTEKGKTRLKKSKSATGTN